MKKLFLFSIICVLLLSVSCTGGGASNEVVFDASNLSDSSYSVGRRSLISITNMDESKMYAVKVNGQNGRTLTPRGAITNENVFHAGGNSWIPIPDKNGMSSFTANEIEINGSTEITLVLLRDGSDDFTIKESEDPISYYNEEGERVYEEYYHIDFSEEPYNQLDKSRISLRTVGTGSGAGGNNWGYVTIGAGGIQPEGYTAGLYDFSDMEFVNLYNSIMIKYSTNPWTSRLFISSPIPCTINTPATITTPGSVMSFVPPEIGADYVLVLNRRDGVSYSEEFNLRYIDGDFHNFTFTLSDSVYYIGKLEKEIIADMTAFAGGLETDDYGSVTFRKATQSEIDQYNSHFITVDSNEYVFNYRIAAYDMSETTFFVKDENGNALHDYEMTSEFFYDDGSYIEGTCRIAYESLHSYGVGYSRNVASGSYSVFQPRTDSLLQKFAIRTMDSEDVNVRITFRKKAPIESEDRYICNLFVVENNGKPVTTEKVPLNGYYTVPNLTWEGHEFRGMYYQGRLYSPGEQVKIETIISAITASWTPRT